MVGNKDKETAYQKYGEVLEKAEVGDLIIFGEYEQDDNFSNGKESLEWRVLYKDDKKLLVISEYALDTRKYDDSKFGKVDWENCSLRRWTNEKFYNQAFGHIEKLIIQSTDMNDKVFILSQEEAERYFSSDESRQCSRTIYASHKSKTGNDESRWWLRDTEYRGNSATITSGAEIYSSGEILNPGDAVYNELDVRPALWLSIEK